MWAAIFSMVCGQGYIWDQDFNSAEEALAHSCSLGATESCLLLCHGLCAAAVDSTTGNLFRSPATVTIDLRSPHPPCSRDHTANPCTTLLSLLLLSRLHSVDYHGHELSPPNTQLRQTQHSCYASTGGYGCPGSTPLYLAARAGCLDCVQELLAWGAGRIQRDSSGTIPYAVASKRNHEVCEALLNPSTAEPLVWPSPLKFISELNQDAKVLLENALILMHVAQYDE